MTIPQNTTSLQVSQPDIPVAVVLITISAVSSFGNLLTGLAIYKNSKLRTSTNYLLGSLSAADFFQASVAIPLRLAQMFYGDESSVIPCSLVLAFTILFGSASNLHIALVSVERFLAVQWPYFHNRLVTKKKIVVVICLAWGFTNLFTLLSFLGRSGSKHAYHIPGICRYTTTLEEEYILANYIMFDFIPLGVVIFVYYFLLKAAYRQTVLIKTQQLALSYSHAKINQEPCTNKTIAGEEKGLKIKEYDILPFEGRAFYVGQTHRQVEGVTQETNAVRVIRIMNLFCSIFHVSSRKKVVINSRRQFSLAIAPVPQKQLRLQSRTDKRTTGLSVDSTNRRCNSLTNISLIKDIRAAKIVATLVGLFIILVLPIIVVDVVEMVRGPVVPKTVVRVAVSLIYANSGVNVFIYCGLNREFRKTFKKMCSLKCGD